MRSTKNVEVCMVESSESIASSNNSNKSYKVLNETPIILSDTDLYNASDSEYHIEQNKRREIKERPKKNIYLQ